MSVKLVIKTPPDTSKLGTVKSTVSGTNIYDTPTPTHVFNPVLGSPLAGVTQPPAVALTFVRNNRVFGPYSDLIQAKLSLAYLITREIEYGSDV